MNVVEIAEQAKQASWQDYLHSWVATVDHKKLGIMYIVTSLIFFVAAGVEALFVRMQLTVAEAGVISPHAYNEVFTMHGTTMIFLVVMPIQIGFATYLVPLMIGARDMAFPRLNAFSFWIFAFGGALMYFSFTTWGGAPDIGWFAYAPMNQQAFSRWYATDYWILGLLITGLGTTGAGINIMATIMGMRAPGMTFGKVPLFVWMSLFQGFLIVAAVMPLTAAQFMLLFDRRLGTHFFDTQAGGSALLWQWLFWWFGHPEVYIMVLPAFGIISEVIPVFSRKVIFGYVLVAAATVGIAFLSMAVFAHHMFAVGMSRAADLVFAGASYLIAVPTGIKIFNWLATMGAGRIVFKTPMLFASAFVGLFTIGGLTGIILATVPVDWQVTDSYFVVAHFHYVLFGGSFFGIMAGFYYWFPKMSGRLMSERLGKWHFWLQFAGFNVTFGVMHLMGIMGMPRRIYTYEWSTGWSVYNIIATCGAGILGIGLIIFFCNVFYSAARGKKAGSDPWDAWTLEWSTTSPPPEYNFEWLPAVTSRRPLWDLKHPDKPDWPHE
jgi:cytochrome c oxidase subunit 1